MKTPDSIASLLPGLTELVCALGLESRLSGRSHECDFPESVTSLPVLTSPRYNVSPDQDNAEIHQSVTELLKQALSIYEVDDEKLLKIKPDAVLTQDHCEVCAVSLSDLSDSLRRELGKNCNIISPSPIDLNSMLESFQIVAGHLGVPERGEELIQSIQSRFSKLRERTGSLPKPDVVAIEWIDPLMTGGNWIPELIEIAGGTNRLATAGKHSPFIEWNKICAVNPDFLLILPCGYPISRTLSEMQTLESRPGWQKLSAVRTGNVYILDGNHYFNRPGPRVADSAEILAHIFHPEFFNSVDTYRDSGWIRYSS
nr:cobalamin-binding protein [Rhodohalobacter sp. SW132]